MFSLNKSWSEKGFPVRTSMFNDRDLQTEDGQRHSP